ncbi:MAG: hypothetical protein GC172_11755 [Phycisphaera sp.]|nr:hypothetical protein [Phycisphaera sp.]
MLILAQDGGFEATLRNALEPLLTPVGMIGLLLGGAFLLWVAFSRHGAFVGGVVILLFLTMMVQENKYFDNTLITPLEQIRALGKTITFATLIAVTANLFMRPNVSGRFALSLPIILLFLFETMYLARIVANGETIRGGFGWIGVLFILLSFGIGYSRLVRTSEDLDRGIRMFAWASAAFICLNLMQLALGPRQAIAGDRFAGISANPQLAGFVSAVFILCNAHLFGRAPLASWSRWLHGVQIGILSVLVVWTGSRMSALCCVASLLMYYRFRLGTFSILLASAGVVFLMFVTLFGDSLVGVSRFVEGENTRRDIWLKLIADFQSAPFFGVMNQSSEEIGASESTYLTTLSLMGISGAIPLSFFVLATTWQFIGMLRARRSGRVEPTQVDFAMGQFVILAIGTVFEGFLLGILSFAVVWVYFVLSFSTALVDDGRVLTERDSFDGEEDEACDGDLGYAETIDADPLEQPRIDDAGAVGEHHACSTRDR